MSSIANTNIQSLTGNNIFIEYQKEFEIDFDAQTKTAAGYQKVGSSNRFKAGITIINLEQCVKVSPDFEQGLRIYSNTDNRSPTSLGIDTSECGPIDIDLRFCQDSPGNTNCRGGTSEGGIILSSWRLNNVREESKNLDVYRGV